LTADTALLDAERALLAKVQSGERLELSPLDPREARTIRAEVLRGFFHDPPGGRANGAWDEVPVWISNAYIEGELDLSDLRRGGWGSLRALYLQDCELPARLKLRHTRLRRLSLRGCAIHHLEARDCRFEALLDLRGLHSAGAVLGALGQPLCHVELAQCRIDGDPAPQRPTVRTLSVEEGAGGAGPRAVEEGPAEPAPGPSKRGPAEPARG
jgi:hypothetical protein